MKELTGKQADQKIPEQSLVSFTVPKLVMEPEEGELMGNVASGRSALLRHKTANSGKGLACSVGLGREVGYGNHRAAHPEAGLTGKSKQT